MNGDLSTRCLLLAGNDHGGHAVKTPLSPLSPKVEDHDADAANASMLDVAGRLATRVQLTTDAHKRYLQALEGVFGADVDFAQLVKIYGQTPEGQRRYSPPECIGTRREARPSKASRPKAAA